MPNFPASPKAHRPLWQTLLAPMLLASLGLHVLFLLIPVASTDEAVIPPPDPEVDNVAITRIPPAADANPQPSPSASATSSQTAPQQAVAATAARPRPVTRPTVTARSTTAPRGTQPRSVSRASGPAAAAAANRADLPSLPGQNSDRDPAANTRSNSTNPSIPMPQPTIPALGQDRRETILAYVAGLDLAQERINQLAATLWQRYGYSTLNTSRGEYTDNLTEWQDDIQQETGLTDLVAEEDRTDFEVEINRRVCLAQPPGDIKIGFITNPDGSFRQDPVLLRSSGYESLDQKALERLGQYAPEQADGIKAYTVTVETAVNYGPNACLSAPQQLSGTSADT